ncbi:hypothetical protein ANCCAN_19379 [Ancylostoma caninum]|uniref:Uncharacterized protein n=1 Tax=Ancylostoma caninum TaxID=29170 RepID=A0A368FTH0_ANCCA|nr:hypothetical protein ANCCAN_19379 [Ancylostoma caninum]
MVELFRLPSSAHACHYDSSQAHEQPKRSGGPAKNKNSSLISGFTALLSAHFRRVVIGFTIKILNFWIKREALA